MLRIEGKWEVVLLMGDGEMVAPISGSEMTLEFDGGRVAGMATINRFMGQLGDDRVLGPLATTMMAGPPVMMEQEQRFLRLLAEADSTEIDPDRLSLFADGVEILTLTPAGTDSEV